MIKVTEIKSLEQFKSLKKGDLVVVEWKRNMYLGNKQVRYGAYEIVENKERATEIILQKKNNVYFNYLMFLFPEEHGHSNCANISLIEITS